MQKRKKKAPQHNIKKVLKEIAAIETRMFKDGKHLKRLKDQRDKLLPPGKSLAQLHEHIYTEIII